MSFIQKLGKITVEMIERHQKAQTMRALLTLNDKLLSDIGISRQELQRGVAAYPWHAQPTTATKQAEKAANVTVLDLPAVRETPKAKLNIEMMHIAA
ncbi:MAG: DUF1127 domain-containing protein [Thiolinea sp.]